MNITIVGGGNIGTQFAVHCAHAGHVVTMLTSRPNEFESELQIVDESGSVAMRGALNKATDSAEEAMADANLVLITVPSNLMKKTADEIASYIRQDALIGVVPGNGGCECAFKDCLERGNTFFAIERVPAVARLVEYGKSVRSVGYRSELHVAALPHAKTEHCCEVVSGIFNMPCKPISCFLSMTLTPSNPILHTARLKSIFADYHDGVTYKSLPLFYEEWDDASSELLLKCDDEVQQICAALNEFDLSDVKSLREHYESPDVQSMTKKIGSIEAFKGLKTPATETPEGFIPDFKSRYFTADFSYGLTIITQIATLSGVVVPYINSVLNWYKCICPNVSAFDYRDYGIDTYADFIEYYSK